MTDTGITVYSVKLDRAEYHYPDATDLDVDDIGTLFLREGPRTLAAFPAGCWRHAETDGTRKD